MGSLLHKILNHPEFRHASIHLQAKLSLAPAARRGLQFRRGKRCQKPALSPRFKTGAKCLRTKDVLECPFEGRAQPKLKSWCRCNLPARKRPATHLLGSCTCQVHAHMVMLGPKYLPISLSWVLCSIMVYAGSGTGLYRTLCRAL